MPHPILLILAASRFRLPGRERRRITIDTSRVALALARTRLMTAMYSEHAASAKLGSDPPKGICVFVVGNVKFLRLSGPLISVTAISDCSDGESRR